MIALRDYQRAGAEAFARLLLDKRETRARALVVIPTRCGKTVTALSLVPTLGRTLWLSHTEELVEQPYQSVRAFLPEIEAGVVKADRDHIGARGFVSASIATLRRPERLERLKKHATSSGDFRFIVPDEAHHCCRGSTYETVIEAFPSAHVLGLTATPERTDGLPIGDVFRDGIVFRYPVATAIAEGWLVPAVVRRLVMPEFDPAKVAKTRTGDLSQEDLARHLADSGEATARATAQLVAEGRKVIVFVVSVALAEEVAKLLTERGCPSGAISEKTPKTERKRLLAGHRAGEIRALVNVMVFAEGYDDQSIDGIVWARPTYSRSLYVQGAGRGLGNYPGKTDCVIVDLVGAHGAHGLQTGDKVFADEGERIVPPDRLPAPPAAEGDTAPDPSAAAERLRSFLAHLAGRELEGQTVETSVRWLVVVPGRCYVLPAGEGGSIHVEREDGPEEAGWAALVEPRDHRAPPERLCAATSLELAQTIGENHARGTGGFRLASRDSGWRRREPTEKLLAACERWRIQVPEGARAGAVADALSIAIARARYKTRSRRPPLVAAATAGLWGDL